MRDKQETDGSRQTTTASKSDGRTCQGPESKAMCSWECSTGGRGRLAATAHVWAVRDVLMLQEEKGFGKR